MGKKTVAPYPLSLLFLNYKLETDLGTNRVFSSVSYT